MGTSNYHQLSFGIRLKNSISKSLLKFMSSNILPILQRENKKGYNHYITTTGKKKNHHLHAFAMWCFFIFIVLFQLFAKNKHIMRGRRALPPPREVYLPALAETRVLVVCWRSLLHRALAVFLFLLFGGADRSTARDLLPPLQTT